MKHCGKQTVRFLQPPSVLSWGSAAGKMEGNGTLGHTFDLISEDTKFGQETWEKAESQMQKLALEKALKKGGLTPEQVHMLFCGDLLNQCVATSFAARDTGIPLVGLYGACSTMAESLSLAAMAVEGEYAKIAGAMASSHFASAERQYRLPLEYGGQRTPTAQWTVTGAGAILLGPHSAPPYIQGFTIGRVVDLTVKDANNMGAAMAPAFVDTVLCHFEDSGLGPDDYDLIVSGDLGRVGHALARELLQKEKIDLGDRYQDCGMMVFDQETQDVHAGGSGCGCSAIVLCGHLLEQLRQVKFRRILFCGTGALLSPVTTGQGESIPGICHAVSISGEAV